MKNYPVGNELKLLTKLSFGTNYSFFNEQMHMLKRTIELIIRTYREFVDRTDKTVPRVTLASRGLAA